VTCHGLPASTVTSEILPPISAISPNSVKNAYLRAVTGDTP
jgi:hypothetical protein